MKKITVILFALFLMTISLAFAQEDSITITTYYPSPYGSYNQLQTKSLGVGDNNDDGAIDNGDVPSTPGDAWIAGKVGIGTTAPKAKLEVDGGIKLGQDIQECNINRAGTMRYNGGKIEYCDGNSWMGIGGGAWAHDGRLVINNVLLSSSWQVLDLSGIFGQRRALVFLKIKTLNLQGNFWARTYGEMYAPVAITSSVSSAGTVNSALNHAGYVIVETDSQGRLEVSTPNTAGVRYNVWLLGYILE